MRSTGDSEFELFLTDLWGESGPGPGTGGRRPYVPSAEGAIVHAAIRRGVTDETGLTDLVFFRRHPARNGRLIARDEPDFGPLSREWLTIRDTVVRPILGTFGPPGVHCARLAGDRDLAAVFAGRLRLAAPGTSTGAGPVRSSGLAVRKMQQVLSAAGYLPREGADGQFGRVTAAAVSRFKADRQIEPPGPMVDARTLRALDVICLLHEGDRGQAIDVSRATRYIAVAGPSPTTAREWGRRRELLPLHRDYALLKVLYTLRTRAIGDTVKVHPFRYDEPVPAPLDFSGLRDTDVIFIAGHGDHNGLFAMGPDAGRGVDRLVKILTGDGNLARLRRNKSITILLLSCRAGLGFHKTLAKRLSKALGIRTTVGGALGFTFGSNRTAFTAHNEVLIRGIPWIMEYPRSLTVREAENETSAREGRTITVAGKKTQIDQFVRNKEALEKAMKDIAGQLRATEVNKALDEIDTRFAARWRGLLRAQFELYAPARSASNLEFDMWFDDITEGYVWTDAAATTDQEVAALLKGDLVPVDATTLTCTR